MAGLYIHIPFCKQACHYCDFHFSTSQHGRPALLAAMARELELRASFLPANTVYETLYFGGGTPSILTAAELLRLMEVIRQHYQFVAGAEVTLEANPDDIGPDSLALWKMAGVNRLSIGIQSFQEPLLKACNRAHDASQALSCVPLAQDHGFHNLSVDLMYGLPGSSLETWEADLQQALQFQVPHLSVYGLTVEPDTAFGRWQRSGKLKGLPPEGAVLEQVEMLEDLTAAAGYEHYEISNFAKPGQYAVHNTNYWFYKPYLGIGPSAHSFDGERRFANVANNARYSKAWADENASGNAYTEEVLTPAEQVCEYILTNMRTQWGLSLATVMTKWGYDIWQLHGTLISQWQMEGLVQLSKDEAQTLTLTKAGRLLADHLSMQLFPDLD